MGHWRVVHGKGHDAHAAGLVHDELGRVGRHGEVLRRKPEARSGQHLFAMMGDAKAAIDGVGFVQARRHACGSGRADHAQRGARGCVGPVLQRQRRKAVEMVQRKDPDLIVDGEMQADTALNPDLIETFFEFSKLKTEANVLIFPNLESANIAYKLLMRLAGAQAIGPILMGMGRPLAVLQKGFDVQNVVTMAAIAVLDSQEFAQLYPAQAAD